MTRPDWLGGTIRHHCPLCPWHLDVPSHHNVEITEQTLRTHFAAEHGMADVGALTAQALTGPPHREGQRVTELDGQVAHFQIGIPAAVDRPHVLAADSLGGARRARMGTFSIDGADGRPMVTLHLDTGEMEFGPGYTPDKAAEIFWDTLDRLGMEPVRRDFDARAAVERAWALVAHWREETRQQGKDPYQDPRPQALAAALLRQAPPAGSATAAEQPVRYDCPMCDWHTHPVEGGTRQSASQQLGGHIFGIHALDPAALVHRLIQLLPNSAGAPRPVPNRLTARLADHLSRSYDYLPLEQLQEEDAARAGEHWAAAHELRPWLKQLPKQDEEEAFKRGWDRAMARAKRRIGELEAVIASRQQDDAELSGDVAVDWAGARQDPRYDVVRRVVAGLETVDGAAALPAALQELAALKVLGSIRETEATS
ncbi:hypothetical protein [Streptomyces sp. NPDC046371]|uniref:hypothetical protein n=1 Tax=Streptomyces sp. NPDC046371 TaxID=3154916 RepID=UPI00340AF5F6